MSEPQAKPAVEEKSSFIDKFLVLKSAPRELWVIYLAKLLEILSYGLMMSTVTLWLSADLGLTDAGAGDVVALWSTLITLTTLAVGSLVDAIGIRKSFLMGFVVCLLTRFVVTVTTLKWVAIPFGLMVMAVGEAMMVPIMTAGVKRYTNVKQRSMAFAGYYVLMNVGFLLSGLTFDKLRGLLGEYGSLTVPVLGEMSTYRIILGVSFLVTIPALIFTWATLRGGVTMTEEGLVIEEEKSAYPDANILVATWLTSKDALVKTGKIFVSVWKEKTFYRFLLFLTLIVFVRLVFYHMHFTFPKYGIRELGPGAPIGQIWGVLNPAVIIVLVPLIGALTQRINSYKMIAIGASLAAAPVFLMAMPPEWFQPLADGPLGHLVANVWLGLDTQQVSPLLVVIPLFVLIFSVGEAFWSPRLYEYTASIAPKGQVGSYMALSLLPYFVAKLVVGVFSGRLLQHFCPSDETLGARYLVEKIQGIDQTAVDAMETSQILPTLAEKLGMVVGPDGVLSNEVRYQVWDILHATYPRDSQTLWLIIACMAAVCPIGIIALKKWVKSHEEGRDD
jgi:MFS family permease